MTMAMANDVPLEHLCIVGSPASVNVVGSAEGLPAESVLGDGVGDRLGVEKVGIVSEVVDIVALLVVVDVVSNTGFTAKELGLLLGLETLGTGKETTGGNAVLDEGSVIGATAELGGNRGNLVLLKELLKVLLDNVRASRAS